MAAVQGPIEGTRPPAGAPRVDVSALGYVVEEYLLEGTAVAYAMRDGAKPAVDGHWDVEAFGTADYRTRLLVVRPAERERFNGTVLVSWLNVSAGFETGAPSSGVIYEDGFAWVGVSAQEVGIYGMPLGMTRRASTRGLPLVEHDPERYSNLNHPGDQGSFTIFADAGRAVRDILADLDPQRVVAIGGSQSAMRLVAFFNGVHPTAPVFDAAVLSVWEGRAPRLEEGPIGFGVKVRLRSDTSIPVIIVNSEFEVPHLAGVAMADTDTIRIWEVAGTPHGVARLAHDRPDSRGWVMNPLSYAPVYDAALVAAHRWLADGVAAPAQPRVDYDGEIGRDSFGNARGGVRLPELEAPTHEYRGLAFGTGRAPLFGAARPLGDAAIKYLYSSRADYEARWSTAVDNLVATGALRPGDAPAMKARAGEVALPW